MTTPESKIIKWSRTIYFPPESETLKITSEENYILVALARGEKIEYIAAELSITPRRVLSLRESYFRKINLQTERVGDIPPPPRRGRPPLKKTEFID